MNDSIGSLSGQNWSASISERIVMKKTETLLGSENTVDLFEKCEKNDMLMMNISSLRNMSTLNGFQYQSTAIPQINLKTAGPSDAAKMADDERQKNSRLNSDAREACRCEDFARAYNSALAITDDNLRNTRLSEIVYSARIADDFKSACDAAKSLTDEEDRNTRLSEIVCSARIADDFKSACDATKLMTDEEDRNTRLSEIVCSARIADDLYSAFTAAEAITDMKSKKIRLREVAFSAKISGNRAVADSAKKSLANLDRMKSPEEMKAEVSEMVQSLSGNSSESLIDIQDDLVNIDGVALKRR